MHPQSAPRALGVHHVQVQRSKTAFKIPPYIPPLSHLEFTLVQNINNQTNDHNHKWIGQGC